jgi:hypothetical protein
VARPRAFSAAARTLVRARSIPVPASDIIAAEDSAKLESLRQKFAMADIDG